MDSKGHLALGCKILSTTAPEVQTMQNNQHMCMPTMNVNIKEEKIAECRDEEESSGSVYMYSSEPLESTEYVNYYDSKIDVLEELKKEFPENESRQLNCSVNCKIISANTGLLPLIKKQKVIIENTEEEFTFNLKDANGNRNMQITIKTERLEEQDIRDNSGATSVHYDVLVTPREVKCKLCDRIFKNNFNLLKHNNDHIQIEMNTQADNEINELDKEQSCDKRYDNYNDMLTHVTDVHSKNNPKCEMRFNSVPTLEHHVTLLRKHNNLPNQVTLNDIKCIYCNVDFKHKYSLNIHMKLCRIGKEGEEIKYKCDSCERVYKHKQSLVVHIKKTHYDYGKMFECWCGKQFPSPIHLNEHKILRHCANREKELYKCKCCEAVYNLKSSLTRHMKKVHYECWCGKQFPSQLHLNEHKSLGHCTSTKNKIYKCNYCETVYKMKKYLSKHMRRMHYDYGRTFDCWCGKQFRTPKYLRDHMKRQHDGKMKKRNNDKIQCEHYQKIFKTKHYLLTHIKSIHYDYGKVFECWCGKQFRTPIHLTDHKRRRHTGVNINDTSNDRLNNHIKLCLTDKNGQDLKYKCESCEGVYKNKETLTRHMKTMHYDYGRMFACWCGKQFRTPVNLRNHMKRHPDGNINDTCNDRLNNHMSLCLTSKDGQKLKYKCETCQGVYKNKQTLLHHIKRVHYDYGRMFACWCGKQFRTPFNLSQHKRLHPDGNINDTSNDRLNNHIKLCLTDKNGQELKYKCESCEGVYKTKDHLTRHMKRMHYDYGRMFACWCGKQFRTPPNLSQHKRLHPDGNINDTSNDRLNNHMKLRLTGKDGQELKYKCDPCGGVYKNKKTLSKHIRKMHYD